MRKLLITAFALLAFAAGSQARTNDKKHEEYENDRIDQGRLSGRRWPTMKKNPPGVEIPRRQTCADRLLRIVVRPLQNATPVLEELAAEYGETGSTSTKVNTEEEQELRRGVRHPFDPPRCCSSR